MQAGWPHSRAACTAELMASIVRCRGLSGVNEDEHLLTSSPLHKDELEISILQN